MTERTVSSPHRLRVARALAASALAVLVLGTAGCSLINNFLPGTEPVRDEATGEIAESSENADVFSLRPGDCVISEATGDEIATIPVVPCGEPHTDEAYFAFDVEGDEFPGQDEILQIGFDGCLAEFEGFVGIAYEESTLDIWPMSPTSSSWAQGDREVLCLVYDYEGAELTGSLKGSGR